MGRVDPQDAIIATSVIVVILFGVVLETPRPPSILIAGRGIDRHGGGGI
jgi:hypothetical protein